MTRFVRHTHPQRSWYRGVTGAMIVACLGVFVAECTSEKSLDLFFAVFALSMDGLKHGRIWQLVTFQFLHGNLMHLAANLISLHFLMRSIEWTFGGRFVGFVWLVAGLLGGVAQTLLSNQEIVGASAAGFAFLLLYTTLFPWKELVIFPVPFPIKAKYIGWGSLLSTVVFLIFNLFPGIGHAAHLAGGLFGLTLGWIVRSRTPFAP